LDALYHKVSLGGFVIIDDYGLAPCAAAVTDFRVEYGITTPINKIDHFGVWWRVDKQKTKPSVLDSVRRVLRV
jgi:hypothetical protein